jgi:hypothetical protein
MEGRPGGPILREVAGNRNSAAAGAETRVQGLLTLIQRSHVEHDARIAMSAAIHAAEVVVVGRGDTNITSRVSKRISEAGGRLATRIGPQTRFAVRADLATESDLEAANAKGVAVIGEDELDRMVDVYTVHAARPLVKAAVKRAIESNRVQTARTTTPTVPVQLGPSQARRMVNREDGARTRATDAPAQPMSEDEQELEQHARAVRGRNASTPFRHQRRPAVR